MTSNPSEMAEALNTYFLDSVRNLTQNASEKVSLTDMRDISKMPPISDEPVFDLCTISNMDIERIIGGLKLSGAKDAFGMNTKFIKTYKQSLITPITSLINESLSTGIFPDHWKISVITAIFKSGDPREACNYRPISILPMASKLIEKCVTEQLVTHLNQSPHNLHEMQFGFRKHYSTEMAECFLLEKIKHSVDKGGVVGAVFLDLKKAFDPVNHRILLNKLSQCSVSPRTVKWLESYLSERKQCVKVNNSISAICNNELGRPQGSALSPLLFSLYINDLPSSCPPNVQCQMYADDAVIYVHARTKDKAAQELSTAMCKISEWLQKSQLVLNVTKTVSMFFSKKISVNDINPPVLLQGSKIESVQEFKYLGVVIDSNLSFKQQIKKVTHNEIQLVKF